MTFFRQGNLHHHRDLCWWQPWCNGDAPKVRVPQPLSSCALESLWSSPTSVKLCRASGSCCQDSRIPKKLGQSFRCSEVPCKCGESPQRCPGELVRLQSHLPLHAVTPPCCQLVQLELRLQDSLPHGHHVWSITRCQPTCRRNSMPNLLSRIQHALLAQAEKSDPPGWSWAGSWETSGSILQDGESQPLERK